jgi:hypothetical protein
MFSETILSAIELITYASVEKRYVWKSIRYLEIIFISTYYENMEKEGNIDIMQSGILIS